MSELIRNRNLWILFFGSLVAVSGSSQVVTLGGIIGERFADNKALATLPLTAHIVGIALFTVPSALIMRRIGRARSLAGAALVGAAAQLLLIYAIFLEHFWWLVAATTTLGLSTAFFRQLRFAAAESVPPAYAGRAISFVLSGSIGGAMLGPTLASGGISWFSGIAHAGGLSLQALLFTVMSLAYLGLLGVREDQTSSADLPGQTEQLPARPLRVVAAQPVFVVALLCGVVSYLVMSLIMTATPLSMHVIDGFTLEQTAGVVRTHVLGMYIPALVAGWLVDRAGAGKVAHAGALTLVVCIVIGLAGHAYMHYWWSMLLLGVGWNFLYTSGTTLLTRTYRASERYTAQAFNEFVVFTMSALASLMAGVLIHRFGWTWTVAATIPAILLVIVALLLVRRRQELKSPAVSAA